MLQGSLSNNYAGFQEYALGDVHTLAKVHQLPSTL